jgi:hypothetical protein
MDHIQDLTARAVSFITFMQDTLLKGSVHKDHKLSSTGIVEGVWPGFSGPSGGAWRR